MTGSLGKTIADEFKEMWIVADELARRDDEDEDVELIAEKRDQYLRFMLHMRSDPEELSI